MNREDAINKLAHDLSTSGGHDAIYCGAAAEGIAEFVEGCIREASPIAVATRVDMRELADALFPELSEMLRDAKTKLLADFVDARIRELTYGAPIQPDATACACAAIQAADPSRHFKGCALRVEREPEATAHKTSEGVSPVVASGTISTNLMPAEAPKGPALSPLPPLSECEASPACPHPASGHVAGRHFCAGHIHSLGKGYREPALSKPAPVGPPDWDESVYRSGAHCDMCDQTAAAFLCARHRGMLAVRGPAPVEAEAPERVTLHPMGVAHPVDYVLADVHEKAVDALRALVDAWGNEYGVSGATHAAIAFLASHDAAAGRK